MKRYPVDTKFLNSSAKPTVRDHYHTHPTIKYIADLAGETEAEKVFADFFSEGLRDVHEKYCQMIYRDYVSLFLK